MTFGETEKAKSVETTLKEAGFTVSQKCCSRPSCFDFAARKDPHLAFVKIQPDTEEISLDDYLELKVLSKKVSATSLLICEKSGGNLLEDDTVYFRHDVLAVTQKTLEDLVLHETYPLIQADRDGYYVEIDGEAIKHRREELGLSTSELAEMTGIPGRVLSGYEQGTGRTSVCTAYRLIGALGVPVARPVDVFKTPNKRDTNFSAVLHHISSGDEVLKKIFQSLDGFNITKIKRAPFDFLIDLRNRITIIGGVVVSEERERAKRVEEILSISKVIQACPLLITDGGETISEEALCIPCTELSEIHGLEDLIFTFK